MSDNGIDYDHFTIAHGKHESWNEGACVMEAVSYVAGEKFSDHPACTSTLIGEFLRAWNDAMNDDDRQMLKPLIPKLVGTKAGKAVELRRSYLALDWHCRVSAPAWLRLAKLDAEAAAVEQCAPIVDAATVQAATGALQAAAKAARTAWAAARDAAGATAGAAAWDAARDAAWDAAWDAAGDAMRPTVVMLQASALTLVEAMIAVTDA